MSDKTEIQHIVDELGGAASAAEKLGTTRQTIWELTSGKERGTSRIYLYALRYLRLLPILRRTKGFREYMQGKDD